MPDTTGPRSLQPKGNFQALSWICRCPRSRDGRFIPLLSSGLMVVALAKVVMLISIVGTFHGKTSRRVLNVPDDLMKEMRAPLTGRAFVEGHSCQEAQPILNIVAPHLSHLPRVASLPFFIVTCRVSCMSRLSRHLKQYPVIAKRLLSCWKSPPPCARSRRVELLK